MNKKSSSAPGKRHRKDQAQVKATGIAVVAIGTRPLIVNRFNPDAQPKENETAFESFRRRFHVLNQEKFEALRPLAAGESWPYIDGVFGFPVIAFKHAMIDAAKYMGIPKEDVMATVEVVSDAGELAPIEYEKVTMRVDKLRSPDPEKPKTTSPASPIFLRHRPEFQGWRIGFRVIFDSKVFSKKVILEILREAGRKIGIGDWRVGRGGMFGTFEAEEAS